MAKQTIVTKLNTNLGGDALQEVRSKGLRPASPETLLKTKGAEAITTTPPAVVGEKIVNIEDNYSKYFGRPPMIFSAADEAILRDQRADAQSTLGILAKGTGKLIGKGILHGLGAFSTIPIMLTAIPFTAGAAAVEGVKSLSQGKSYDPTKAGNMFAAFYDNALSKALDKGVEGLDNLMPIYKTQREQNAKFWSFENLASTKFLAEDFFGGMAFLLGNYIGGAGVGGVVRSFGLASKAMKKASQIKRALSTEDFVNIALKGKVLDSRITAAGQTLLAGYEAGIQARQFRESALEDFRTKYIAENLRNPTDEIMAEFSDNITATANGIFMANMLLTSVDNVVMFNKTFGRPLRDSIGLVNKKGKLAGLRAAAAGEEAADIATRLIPPSRLGHVLKTSGSFLLKPVYEGTQEFLQEVFNQAGIKYVLSKYSPEGHDNNYGFMKNMSAAFGEAFKETYNSEEAMKEAYIGLLLGLVGIPGVATGSIKEIREVFRKPQVSQYSIDYHKFNTGNVLKGVASNLSRQYEIARDKEKAMRNNDFLAAKDEDAKEFLSWMSSRFNVGLLNEEIDRYIDTLDKMTNDEFKEELGNDNLNDAEIKERKEHIKKSILRNRKSFIKAKNLSDRIVSNSIEESKREDLEDLITFTIFMSEDANNRLNDINETIKQNTGLSLMDENENGNVLNYFDSDGNIIDAGASTAKLRTYASDPNNYMELATMIKDHEILTRKKDAYSDLIKKFYDVKAQVSFADNLAQKKFDIFRKFAHAVSITKKYELLKNRLEVAKQQLEAELKTATDPNIISDIKDDLKKVNDKIVEVTNKIKQRFPVNIEMQTFAMMVNAMVEGNVKAAEIVSPTAIETIDDLNLITKIGASAKGRASIGTIGSGTAVNKVYYPGEDSPLGEVPEGTSVTIYEIDENNTPLVYSINRYNVKKERFVQSFFKTNEERKPVPFNYDDFVIFLNSLSDTGIEFKDINQINIDNFVNFSLHDSLNEGLYIIVNAVVDPTTGAESENRFNTTTHDDLSDSAEITEKIVERFTKRNELLPMIPESNEEARYTALVSNEQSLEDFDNDATIEDFDKYTFQIITSDSESEPGIVLVTLKATVKNEFLSEPDIVTEEEFTVSIYTNKFEFEGPLKDKYEKQKEDLNKQISKALSFLGRRKEENNKKRNGYDVGKAQVGTEAISIFNNKIIRPRGVTISPEQIAEIENQTKAPASEYFEAQLNAGKAIIITKIISPPGTKGDVVVEVTVLENNEAFINDYINLNWYTENESIKNSEQEVREKYIEGLTFLIKRYIAESKTNNPPQDGTEFEPDFSFTKSIYDDNELDLNNIMSEVDAIEEKISKDQASKIGSNQKTNAFNALEDIYNQVDTIINKPNATNEELQQAIELVKKHAFLIGSFKYNASIGIDLTDDEETKLNKAEAKLSDYLAFFLRNTEIDFYTDIEKYNDLVETLTEEELAEFPILEFQDGMLISDNVIDQVLKLKAGKTVVVHSLLFPAVFSKDTNDLLVDPEVQIMSFTPDQIAAIKNNPDQYKKKFADVINEKYNKPKPPKGKKPPASPPSAPPPSSGVTAFNGNYTIENPVLPESTDFLREIMLINTENDKAYNHIDNFFRTLRLDKYSYTDLLQIFGFSSLAEIKRATTNEIESINSSVRSTAAEDIVFIKLQRSVNLNYNQRKAIDVQPGNTSKNIIVVAKKVGDKLIPIGELEYYDAFVDQQGNPLGPRPSSISTVIAPMYEEAYNTVKSIWDNATLGVPYTPNNVSTIFYPKKLTQNMLVSELIDNGYTDIYAMFGKNVFKYNKEDKLWVANNEMFGDLLLTRDEQEFTNNNIIFVKIGTTYHILPINSKLESNARLKKGEADVAKIFQIAYDNHQQEVENLFSYSTLEEIENQLELTRKSASNIKAGLDFKNNNFRYPFFIPQVNNSNNMIVRESDNENIYLSHEIGDLRIRIFNENGKYIIRGGVKQKGKPEIGFKEFSLGNRFNIELYLQGIKTVVSNFHKQDLLKDIIIGQSININIKSGMSINGLTVTSIPSPALRIELSAVANAKPPKAPATQEEITIIEDVQGIMADDFTGEKVGDFKETSMFFPSMGVNEEMEKVNKVSVNKALRVLLYAGEIYIRGNNKKGDPVYVQSKVGPVVDERLINTLKQQEDSLVVGYVTAALNGGIPYYVNKQGEVTSGITGKAVYDTPSSKTTRKNISDAISTINDFAKNADKVKGSVAYRPATEQQTGDIIADTDQELAYNIQALEEERDKKLKEADKPKLKGLERLSNLVGKPFNSINEKDINEDNAIQILNEIFRIRKNGGLTNSESDILQKLENKAKSLGYEIINPIGQKYDARNNIDVTNFVQGNSPDSESIVITKVSKPQVNKNGILEQRAEVEVMQSATQEEITNAISLFKEDSISKRKEKINDKYNKDIAFLQSQAIIRQQPTPATEEETIEDIERERNKKGNDLSKPFVQKNDGSGLVDIEVKVTEKDGIEITNFITYTTNKQGKPGTQPDKSYNNFEEAVDDLNIDLEHEENETALSFLNTLKEKQGKVNVKVKEILDNKKGNRFAFLILNGNEIPFKLKSDDVQITPEQKTTKTVNAKGVKRHTGPIKPDEDIENSPFATANREAVQEDISKAKAELAKIVPFDVEEMSDALQNMLNDGTAIGAFHKNTIYLLEGGVAYHEAFHGVFRTLMSESEVVEVLRLAKQKYEGPTLEDINKLRNLTAHNQKLTTQQLIDLYYEEKLADDFQNYMDTGKSFFARFWRKIIDFLRKFFRHEQDLYTVFRGIEVGNYAKATARTTAPYAFTPPAYATLKSLRTNNDNEVVEHYVSKKLSLSIAGKVFSNLMKQNANLSEITNEDFQIAVATTRDEFDPSVWYRYFVDNNVEGIKSKMMMIIDFYNSLLPENNEMYFYGVDEETGEEGLFVVDATDSSMIKGNLDFVSEHAKKMISMYSGEVYDELEENEEAEEDTNLPDEMIRKDSNRYGGFKSESQAFKLFIGTTTIDKELFKLDGIADKKVVEMPIDAQRVYSKINRILSGKKPSDFMGILEFAAKDDIELSAFVEKMKKEIKKELSIVNDKDFLLKETTSNIYHNSPTWNLMIKTFYKTNHDYMHSVTKKELEGGTIINYFPNRKNYADWTYNNWVQAFKRLEIDNAGIQEALKEVKKLIKYYKTKSPNDKEQSIRSIEKILSDKLGISLSKGYIRYSLEKDGVPGIDKLNIDKLTIDLLVNIGNGINSKLDEKSENKQRRLFNDNTESLLKKLAIASTYFDDKNTSFMLRTPDGELAYTSLYNSYDTEMSAVLKDSFDKNGFSFDLLADNLRKLSYPEYVVKRFVSMAKLNPMFASEDLTPDDFNIIYSFGLETNNYSDLEQVERDYFKVRAYLSNPSGYDTKTRRMFNPIIIEAKNTNKLIPFTYFKRPVTKEDGMFAFSEDVINSMMMFARIELTSILSYYNDIDKITKVSPVNVPGKGEVMISAGIPMFVNEFHYNEYVIDGESKIVIQDRNGKFYTVEPVYDEVTYSSHHELVGYQVNEIQQPVGFKQPKGAKMFQFEEVREEILAVQSDVGAVKGILLRWLRGKMQEEIDTNYIKRLFDKVSYEVEGEDADTKYNERRALEFFINDLIASMSYQYMLYGGSPTFNHKDYVDITKRNAGVNASGPNIGNTKTKVAILEDNSTTLTDPSISKNNEDTEMITQDGQSYATALWYFSKFAKYKSVIGLKDIGLKIVAGVKLNSREKKILAKNNMLLISRKGVIRNTFLYNKTSIHIQARETMSIPLYEPEVLLNAWSEYLLDPTPERYNKMIVPMYVAKPGFEYHHNMLNSMEAQGIDITMMLSASKMTSFNIAKDPVRLQGFFIDDKFIKEQVKTDNIKTNITDPTQALALLAYEQSSEFQEYGYKFLEALSKRSELTNNVNMQEFFPDGVVNYELIWDKIKETLSITDPHLYELLDVENGVPKYNWNLPNVNNRVIASFASMMSKNGPKHKNKGTKASLVSAHGYGSQLNWKTELEDYPGVYFSEVYVTQYFLDKMGLEVGDIMWGTRIPTEDKYSMGNMVIKGVVEGPYAMSIFLPNELMFLSGADFDLDAMYIKALNNPKGRELLKAVFDKSRSIDDIIKEFEEETDKDNIKLLDDIITFLSLTLTHNSGNQDIYSTAASTDLIGKSRVRSRDVSQKSSVSFFDRSKAEASNTLAKYGIGPAAVANIAYQKLYISDPESYPLTNKEGIRINRINATHIAGMTDDAKKQIMSRYGLSDENINDILAFMLYYDTTYTQALAAVRDFNSLITSNDFNMSFLNTMRDNMTPQEFAASVAAYEQEGYTVERNEEGIAIRMYMVPDSPANIIKNVKDLKNYMRIVGTVIRLNRKMPATASEYFVLEKSLRSSGVVVQRKYADKGSKAYNEAMSFLGGKSFVTIGDKVFVNTGNEVVILTYSIRQDFSNKYKGDLYNMIIEDDVIRTELGAYLAYGEFNKKVFIKYKPMFRLLSDKVGELVSSLKNDIEIAILNDFDNRDIEAIERNIDDYVLAALNAMSYIDTYNKKIYTEVFYDSMPDGESYMSAVSTRILQEDFVKLLYDTKYEKLEDGTHHITISTINDETDGLKTEYSNDYTNLYNSSRNWAVMDDFIAAEDKQAFINALDINDAKLLMAMMIFNYTMTKDAMMYTPTSFSKIIDPRLFVKYGKASSDIAEAFNSFTSYKNYYGIELVNQHMDILSGKIYGSLLNYLSGQKGKRAFTIVKDHTKQDLNTEKVTAYYAAPGTGKTMLAKKYPGQFMDMDTVVENAFKSVYGRSFDPGTHSLLLNIVMQNASVGAIKMADDVAAELELDPAKMFEVVKNVKETIYAPSNRNKFLFSAYKADKMKIFGKKMEYKAYYVPAIENVVSFVDKIMERDSDSFLADKTRFKTKKEATEFYLEYYVKPYSYNAIIVGDNLEDTIRSEDIEKDKREANDSGKYISYQGNEYLVIGYDKDIIVYDDNRKRIRPDKAMKLFLSQAKDFADKRSVAFTFNGKDYYTNFDKVIYSVTDNEIVKDAEKELVDFARDKYNKYFAMSKGVKVTYKSSKSNDRKTYYVIGDRILNERLQEVFVKDSVDRNKILLNAKKVKDDLVTVTKDGVQYLVDRNGVIASKENGKRLTLDEDLAKEVVSFANDLFAEKDAQPEAEMIYKALPKKTRTFGEKGKVYPDSKYQNYKTDPSVVYSMRLNGTEHFDNPFSHDKELVRNYKLIKVANVKESVLKYIEWILSEETDINPEQHAYIREKLMSGELKGKKIIYYSELNEPSHANALDYLINQYSWSVEQETTEELEKLDISGIVKLMSPSAYYDQYHNTFPKEYPYTKEKFIRLAEAVGLKEIHDTIQNCRTKKNT